MRYARVARLAAAVAAAARSLAAEAVIDAGAENVVVHRDIVGGGDAAIGAAIEAAEIDVQIFRLRRPVAGQRKFDAAADGPAGTGVGGAGKARRRGANVAD